MPFIDLVRCPDCPCLAAVRRSFVTSEAPSDVTGGGVTLVAGLVCRPSPRYQAVLIRRRSELTPRPPSAGTARNKTRLRPGNRPAARRTPLRLCDPV